MDRYLLWAGTVLVLLSGCTGVEGEPRPACQDDPAGCDTRAETPQGGAAPPSFLRALAASGVVKGEAPRTFRVIAEDSSCDVLHFAWSASAGTLSEERTTAVTSQVTWTAPRCVPTGTSVVVTATVTNESGLSATTHFTALGLPDCHRWVPTGSLSLVWSPDWVSATPLKSGKVLVLGNEASRGEVYDPATGTWSLTGPTVEVRGGHTAALLDSGKVLVMGGSIRGRNETTLTAELYDPETNTWSRTGDLHQRRSSARATLLRSGKVLVVGGDIVAPVVTAELYDPETGTWSPTGSLNVRRHLFSLTALSTGQALVVGGEGSDVTEVYDPETGTWAVTGRLTLPRYRHRATLLSSGKVLVTGGNSPQAWYVAMAEVYDPETGTWSPTHDMSVGRSDHSATLLPSGKVLVVGGVSQARGGLASAEVYDPETGRWALTASLSMPRHSHLATLLLSGEVLVVGGGTSPRTAELYTRQTQSPVPDESDPCQLDPARCEPGAVTTPGEVSAPDAPFFDLALESRVEGTRGAKRTFLVVAVDPLCGEPRFAWSASHGTLSAEVTDSLLSEVTWTAPHCVPADTPVTVTATVTSPLNVSATTRFSVRGIPDCSTWAAASSPAAARAGHTATLLSSGKVLVVGGDRGGERATAELYDPATGAWTSAGALTTGRREHTATLLPSGQVLVTGGVDDSLGTLDTAEVYDPATGAWTATGGLALARTRHTATLLPSGKVLVVGGSGEGPLATAEIYDPATGTWASTGDLATARHSHTATLLSSGQVLVTGGQGVLTETGGVLDTAELYDPDSGRWSTTGRLATARQGHTATLLPSGRVLVAGGLGGVVSSGSAELYDPVSGTWASTGGLATARHFHTAMVLPSGKVLVSGGANRVGEEGTFVGATAEVYDPATGTWNSTGPLATARERHTATLLPSGTVLVVGGQDAGVRGSLATAELYTR